MLGHNLCGVGLVYLCAYLGLVVGHASLVPKALCFSYGQVAFCGSAITF